MLYLVATIVLNTVLFLLFKLYARFGADNLQVIVVNYWTCVVTGSLVLGASPITADSLSQPWLPWSMLMGTMFFIVFNLLAYCTLKEGITTTTVANKLSLVIPVLFALFLYDEHLGAVKIAGILLAFPAVYLTTRVEDGGKRSQELLWPILIFIGSGLLDTMVKFVEHTYIDNTDELVSYTIYTFIVAGTVGLVAVAVQVLRRKIKLQFKNVVAGIILGIPNYFSIYYLMKFLRSGMLQSSAAIPVVNIGIVLLSALSAILFFREKTTRLRIVGLILSILAILLIASGDLNGTGV
jgi:drug/metabolite transporter (DMT)-like permease